MRTLHRLGEGMRARWALRVLVLAIYAVLFAEYFLQPNDHALFIGMVRAGDDPGTPLLFANMPAVAFMAAGVALAAEQPMEFLASPDWLVYVRRPRTVGHFLVFLCALAAYCAVFSGVQLAVALALVPFAAASLASTCICAAWMLLCLLLTVTAGILAGNRIAGYAAATILLLLTAGVGPVQRWFCRPGCWPVALALLTCTCITVCLVLFARLEIR